jgi:antitoxin (DNA-binding transcriptional repressor) of toxin-antitoxin stability system
MKASELRQNIYRILDRVLETGEPVIIERKGRLLRIVTDEPPGRLASLRPNPDYLAADPDDVVHVDWSEEWRPPA